MSVHGLDDQNVGLVRSEPSPHKAAGFSPALFARQEAKRSDAGGDELSSSDNGEAEFAKARIDSKDTFGGHGRGCVKR